MAPVLVARRPGRPEGRFGLDGPASAGGSAGDPIHLPGAPPAAARLEPGPAGVAVEARARGVRVAGVRLRPGTRALLRPGERAALAGWTLTFAAAAPEDARALAGQLLRAAVAGRAGMHLAVAAGPQAGRCLPLAGTLTVGRGGGAGLRLDDPGASRRHARLVVDGGGAVRAEDLDSTNGLWVNGARTGPGPLRLSPGDRLRVGATCLLLLRLPEMPPPPASTPAPPPTERSGAALAAGALLAFGAAALAAAAAL